MDLSKYNCVYVTILKRVTKIQSFIFFVVLCNCFKKSGELKLKEVCVSCLVLHINSTTIFYPSLKNGEIKGKDRKTSFGVTKACGACGCQ